MLQHKHSLLTIRAFIDTIRVLRGDIPVLARTSVETLLSIASESNGADLRGEDNQHVACFLHAVQQ